MAKRKSKTTVRPAWRELYNLRRRIAREAVRIAKAGKDSLARALMAEVEQLKPQRGKISAKDILSRLKSEKYKQPHASDLERNEARITQLFKAEIKNGNIDEVRIRGLYAATRQIWQGQAVNNRNEKILEYFYGDSDEAKAFQEWAREHGESLNVRNLFLVERYIRDENMDVLQRAAAEGDYPYKAFGLLITFG